MKLKKASPVSKMLKKQCPECGQKISYSRYKEYIQHDGFQCPYCLSNLTVNQPMTWILCVVLGACTGALLKFFTSLNNDGITIVATLIAIVSLKYCELILPFKQDD